MTARRWFVPEVVQTSAMDCGPAALKSLLEGFGVNVSYGRLREACQTDIDGTSIDALEEVARQVGLDAEQRVVPVDNLFLPESNSLPGLLVVRLPNGLTHFVVAWRVHLLGGPFDDRGYVQLMDPGQGRRWVSIESLRDELYVHALPVPASAWREHAATSCFLDPLRRRLRRLGVRAPEPWVAEALADAGWQKIAALDAAVRAVTELARAGAVEAGPQCEALVEAYYRASNEVELVGGVIPSTAMDERFWPVRPLVEPGDDGEPQVLLIGCVVMPVSGLVNGAPAARLQAARDAGTAIPTEVLDALSPELAAALSETPTPTWRTLVGLLRHDGVLAPGVLAAALVVSSVTALGESVLFRSLFEIAAKLGHGPQRLWGAVVVILFLSGLVALELPIALGLLRAGRQLENRMRVAFLEKLPRLGDRYFSSRPMFDLTERSHSVQQLRALPPLAGAFLRAVSGLAVTTLGIALVAPRAAVPAVVAAVVSVALPLVVQRPLAELDLRYRSHAGALGRFYLDALLGLTAVRTHGAERAIRREHESLLVEWARAARSLARAAVWLEGLEAIAGLALGVSLLLGPFADTAGSGAVLLLAYWALTIPALGAEVAQLARQYPDHRNVALRLLEPLGAREDQSAVEGGTLRSAVSIRFEEVTVCAAGHNVLEGISMEVAPASHVAIVGRSGAGKSSLVGVLLGWHTPSAGRVLVNGEPLEGAGLATLRKHTAWVDPGVHLWNRPLLENLRYGTHINENMDFGEVVHQADLGGVLERLPDGMQSSLGENGALVSGGEGQRVRLGRGMLRPDVRLAILDEPFRGLDREHRGTLLKRARTRWRDATLLCITHDMHETLSFDRVLVVEGGRVVEDGDPRVLSARDDTRFRALLDAESALHEGLWSSPRWRRVRVEGGTIREVGREPAGVGGVEEAREAESEGKAGPG